MRPACRQAVARSKVPLAAPYVREPLRRCWITPLEIARFMGHATVTTTLTVYTRLFGDDHADAMAALGAMETPKLKAGNVVPMCG